MDTLTKNYGEALRRALVLYGLMLLAACSKFPGHLKENGSNDLAQTLAIVGSNRVAKGICSPYSVQALGKDKLPSPLPLTLPLTLSASVGTFYSDSACSSAVQTVEIAANSSTAAIYFAVPGVASETSAVFQAEALGFTAAALEVDLFLTSQLTLTPNTVYNFGNTAIFSTNSRTFTLDNTSGNTATSIALSSVGGAFAVTNQTCTSELVAGDSCTFDVGFTPTAIGASNADLRLAYSDGHALQTLSVILSGVGVQPPTKLAVSFPSPTPTSLCAAGLVELRDSTDAAASSSSPLTVLLSGAGAGSFYGDPACGNAVSSIAVPPNTSSFAFYFKSATAQTLNFTAADQASVLTSATVNNVSITSNAVLSASVPSVQFSTEPVNTTAVQTVTITNQGMNPASDISSSAVAAPFGYAGGTFPGTAGNCGSTLAAGASCDLQISFRPTASGAFTNRLNLFYQDGASYQVVSLALEGAGVEAPTRITLTGAAHSTTSACASYRLSTVDGSGQPAPVMGSTTISLSGQGAGSFYTDATCQSAVSSTVFNAGTSARTLYFRDATAESLTLAASAAGLTAANIAVQVDAPANLEIAPATYAYGTRTVGTSQSASFTVTNSGGTAATSMAGGSFSSGYVFTGGVYPGVGGNCGTSLAPGANCTVRVAFAPGSIGFLSSALTLFFNDGTALQAAQGSLTGTGTGAPVSLTLTGPTFPIVASCFAVTVQALDGSLNPAPVSSDVTVTFGGQGLGAFYTNSGCSTPGNTRTITTGTSSASIYFRDNTAESLTLGASASSFTPGSLSLTLNNPAQLSLSDGPTYNFGALITSNTASYAFTVTNNGGTTATSLGAGSLPAPFGFLGGSFPGTGGTCLSTLAPTQSCTVVVRFAPITQGSFATALSVIYSDGVGIQAGQIALTGQGAGAPSEIRLTGPASVTSDTCSAFSLRTTDASGINVGVLSSTTLTLGGVGAGRFYSDSGCTSLITNRVFTTGMASVNIYFRDNTAESLTLTASAGGLTTANTALTVLSRANLTISGSPTYDFLGNNIGVGSTAALVVTNSGQVTATALNPTLLAAPFSFYGGSYPGTGGSCGSTLAAGASCSMQVRFLPPSAVAYSDSLRLIYSDGVYLQVAQIGLRGLGVRPSAPMRVSGGFGAAVWSIAPSADNTKLYAGGSFTSYNETVARGVVRLNLDLSADTSFSAGGGPNNSVSGVLPVDDGSGKVYIFGAFTAYDGTSVRHIARLTATGALDTSFDPGTADNNTLSAAAIVYLSGGGHKVVIGGTFTTVRGVSRTNIARLNSDGSLDTGFTVGTGTNAPVAAITAFPGNDPKVYIAGGFTTYNSTTSAGVARLNFDGTIDSAFAIGTLLSSPTASSVLGVTLTKDGSGDIFVFGTLTGFGSVIRVTSTGVRNTSFSTAATIGNPVRTVAIASDGTNDILIGNANPAPSASHSRVMRMTGLGAIVTSFNPGTSSNGQVWGFIPAPDGSNTFFVAGQFTAFNGVGINRIVKLTSTGTIHSDTRTGSGITGFGTAYSSYTGNVTAIYPRRDGSNRVLIAGNITNYRGNLTYGLVSIHPDAVIDQSFNAGGSSTGAAYIAEANDGSGNLYVGGIFTFFNGTAANGIVSINSEGSVRTDFQSGSGFNNQVTMVASQPGGSGVYVGGTFTTYNGVSVNRLVRLTSTGAIDTAFAVGTGLNAQPNTLVPVGDGTNDIYVGGIFSAYNGTTVNRIVRLRPNGAIESSFAVGTGFAGSVQTITRLSSSQIYVGGTFTSYQGINAMRIARLNADGTMDTSFDAGTGFNSTVWGIALGPLGQVYATGVFTQFQGVTKNYICGLTSTGSLNTTFDVGTGLDAQGNVLISSPDGSGAVIVGGNFSSYKGMTVDHIVKILPNGDVY